MTIAEAAARANAATSAIPYYLTHAMANAPEAVQPNAGNYDDDVAGLDFGTLADGVVTAQSPEQYANALAYLRALTDLDQRAVFANHDARLKGPNAQLITEAGPHEAGSPSTPEPSAPHPLDGASVGTTATLIVPGNPSAPATTLTATKEANGTVSIQIPDTAHNSAFKIFGADVASAVKKALHWLRAEF